MSRRREIDIIDITIEDSVSEFIIRTCQILPKTRAGFFESIDLVGANDFATHGLRIVCGSCAEFFIQPIRSCVGDIDYCHMIPNLLAFTDDRTIIMPYDVLSSASPKYCYVMEPSLEYPAFLQLRFLGQTRYNWNAKPFEFLKTRVHEIAITSKLDGMNIFIDAAEYCRVGPANRGRVTTSGSISMDIVESIWCPHWPNEASNWPTRRRKYGWPTTAIIHEVVQNGCHVVFAKHPDCRNDVHQCRLSFSVSEVILIQSWTTIQQIVYHMLRFFAKRELIKKNCPKEDEVLCTYHFKTLMLWSCEEMSPEWWNSLSAIEICCNLFENLSQWLTERTCPNYFIPEANLFHTHLKREFVDETVGKLIRFSNSCLLSLWFVQSYVQPEVPDSDENFTPDLSTCVYDHMLKTCQAMNADKRKAMVRYVLTRHCGDVDYAHTAATADEVSANAFHDFLKNTLRIESSVEYELDFCPSAESEPSYWPFEAMLRTLHAVYLLDCREIEWDSERFVDIIRRVFIQPKFLRSMHHNLPRPLKFDDRRQLHLIKAQDLMENLIGSCNDREFKIVSELSNMLLGSALECESSITNTKAILCYMAALSFAASDYQIVTDLCSRVIMDERSAKKKTETLNAGCMLFLEEISKITGFYLIFMKIRDSCLHYTKRPFYLDLRLTPEIFARYLTIESIERTDESSRPNYISQVPTYPLDVILMSISNNKLSRIIHVDLSCVYQRVNPKKKLEAVKMDSLPNAGRISQLLMEYSLQNLTSFCDMICKDYDINCIVVDCYRAAYLYKCRRYSRVLKLCERILDEPDLSSNSKITLKPHVHVHVCTFANVMVLPPLDSYFDSEVQTLLGFHTLYYYLSLLFEDFTRTQETSEYMLKGFFIKKVRCDKCLLCDVLGEDYIDVKCNYFLGRHFLASYLKVRCLVDSCNSISDAVSEFQKLKANLPFEIIMRCFLQQKLRRLRKM